MTEREQQFEDAIADTFYSLQYLLQVKGKEYRRENNPYHNFERGAEMTDFTREEVLQGFLRKHLISVEDMRNDVKLGHHQSPEKINEKYNDILIYFMIEKAMMLENAELYAKSLNKAKEAIEDMNKTNIFTRDD